MKKFFKKLKYLIFNKEFLLYKIFGKLRYLLFGKQEVLYIDYTKIISGWYRYYLPEIFALLIMLGLPLLSQVNSGTLNALGFATLTVFILLFSHDVYVVFNRNIDRVLIIEKTLFLSNYKMIQEIPLQKIVSAGTHKLVGGKNDVYCLELWSKNNNSYLLANMPYTSYSLAEEQADKITKFLNSGKLYFEIINRKIVYKLLALPFFYLYLMSAFPERMTELFYLLRIH